MGLGRIISILRTRVENLSLVLFAHISSRRVPVVTFQHLDWATCRLRVISLVAVDSSVGFIEPHQHNTDNKHAQFPNKNIAVKCKRVFFLKLSLFIICTIISWRSAR